MSIDPIANFPLRASDQADIIEIFLDLMRQSGPASAASELAGNRPIQPRPDSGAPWSPSEPPDRA